MKKALSALLSFSIAAASFAALPLTASGAELYSTSFEDGLDGWSAHGSAKVELVTSPAASGSQAVAVTNRSDSWNGIEYKLDTTKFKPGESYSFSAMVTQTSTPAAVQFKMTLQYSTGSSSSNPTNPGFDWSDFNFGDMDFGNMDFGGMDFSAQPAAGGQNYDTFVKKDVASGMWSQLATESYTIPADATDAVLYIETEDSTTDFFVDDIVIGTAGSVPDSKPSDNPKADAKKGDINADNSVNAKDAAALRDYLLGKSDDLNGKAADLDGNKIINAADLSALKDLILNPPPVETTPPKQETTPPKQETTPPQQETTPPQQETTPPNDNPDTKTHMSAKEYNAKVAATMTRDVPGNVKQGDQGKLEKISYFSQKANRNKPANVWTPPGYDSSKKYPVMFMNHGVMGGEGDMVKGWSICEMASQLAASGEAVPFIIVFTQMYTDPKSASPMGITMDVMDAYDNFVYDMKDSLYPYICEHYSVATGRENTAIAGFSMGGRESLYLGMMLPEMFGYVCASSPAPGIVPASDAFISNHLGSKKLNSEQRMTNADFKFSDADLPYLLMIGGGTNDQVVGTFPKQYHELFDKNGTPNIWMEVPGGGHDASVGTPLFYNFFKAVFQA